MRWVAIPIVVFAAVQCGRAKADPTYDIAVFNVPGYVSTSISLTGINNLGQIVGNYTDPNGVSHGFLTDAAADQFTLFDDPVGSGTNRFTNFIHFAGINDNGQIVGYYLNSAGVRIGFLRNPTTGSYTVLPSAPPLSGAATNLIPLGINDAGQIVGQFPGIQTYPYDRTQSVVLNTVTGTSAILSDPAARFATYGLGINDANIVLGNELESNARGSSSFLFNPATGIYTQLNNIGDYPTGSTTYTALNDLGQTVGYTSTVYIANGVSQGFLREPDGTVVSLTDPAATGGLFPQGINSAGEIVGDLQDTTGNHSFIATPETAVTTVPEPRSLDLIGAGLLGVGVRLGGARARRGRRG